MKTRTFRLNKLVRDKIISDHIKNGGQVKMRRLTGAEKRQELLNKLVEEAREAKKSGSIIEELADIQEILEQLIKDEGQTKRQIRSMQAKKRASNGGFKRGDYIEHETWPADHKWAKYYSKEPKRFPEIRK